MRIYAVADIHGRSKRIERIEEKIAIYEPDLLVAAGDITRFFNPDPTIAALEGFPVPVLALRGNSDRKRVKQMIEASENIASLHLRRYETKGISMAGIGGTIPLPFRTRVALREEALFKRFAAAAQNTDILVSHPPPYGILDRVAGRVHAGWKRLAGLIEELSPTLVICGHIHESAGFALTGQTMVVNCAMGDGRCGALVDMEKGAIPEVRMI